MHRGELLARDFPFTIAIDSPRILCDTNFYARECAFHPVLFIDNPHRAQRESALNVRFDGIKTSRTRRERDIAWM